MRTRSILPGFGLLLLAAFVFVIAGCSDDKTPATSNLTPGSETDPQFLLIQDQINEYLDSTQNVFSIGLENISKLPTDTDEVVIINGPLGPNDTALYSYANGWHVMYIAKYALNFDVRFRDSVQFKNDGVAVETPNPLDYLHFIRYWVFTSNLTSQTHTDMSRYINLIYDNLDTDTASINGTNNSDIAWTYINGDTTITATLDMNVTVDNINVVRSNLYGWVSGCPCSGTLDMTIGEEYEATDGTNQVNLSKDWTVTIEVEDGVATIDIVSGTETWHYTYTICLLG